MRMLFGLMSVLMLATVAASVASAAERTPPGSYLVYRATSVGELRQQLATNKIVQARYAKHFGVAPKEFDRFLADGVELVALKAPLLAETWYVDRRGRTTTKKKMLPTGTMVFATKNGDPVLTWSCGNPLRASLPISAKLAAATSTVTSPVETKVLANPVETITSAVITAPPATAVAAVAPVEAAPELSYVSAPAVSMPPIIAGLGALGALGGLVLTRSGPPPSVPEPSSLLAIGMGLGLVPTVYRIRRRSRKQ